jgi:hypothetical protein
LNTVTYDGSLSSKLTLITPRYGTVTGGETISFQGTGFTTNAADVTVTIDGIDCSVTSSSATEI